MTADVKSRRSARVETAENAANVETRQQPTTELAEILTRCAEKERGLARLARRVGIHRATLYRLIHGKHVPGWHVSRALARYLELTVDEDMECAGARKTLQAQR